MSDGLVDDMRAFFEKNCDVFEDKDENKLVYTTVFNQFVELFDTRLEGVVYSDFLPSLSAAFLAQHNQTKEQFVTLLSESKDDSAKFLIDLLVMSTEFDTFKSEMISVKEAKKALQS